MKDDELKALFKKAAEISKAVPESLREAAFNRAVDVLIGGSQKAGAKTHRKPKESATIAKDDNADPLLVDLDSTAYPQMQTVPRVLERALILLRIAKDDFGIDGLGSARISKVLTDKFRLRASYQAVQQALDAAGDKVDRVSVSRRTTYRIMAPGEAYLDAGQFDVKPKPSAPKKQAFKKKAAAGKAHKSEKKKSTKTEPSVQKIKMRSVGPTAALKELITEGYFNSPRRIADIQSYLQHKRGLSFRVVDLSTPLVRLLRNKIVDRTQAEDGQYEYTKA